MTTWGLSATILAPSTDILRFAAYHLEAGAQRLYLYLDDPESDAYAALKAHPKIRVTRCDDAHWAQLGGGRPKKHQVRQTANATHAYHRNPEVDWLIHMDVDEFLVSDQSVALILGALPARQVIARIRPMEMLAGDGTAFKAFIPNGPDREAITADLYPTYGAYLKGGFLSHLAGKVFIRTGLADIRVQIHNVFQNGGMLTGPQQQAGIDLAHLHATSWENWIAGYRYRLEKGSYRPELAPNRPHDKGGLSMHEVFQMIEAEDGEAGLRHFFTEVCCDTPVLREKLARHCLLKRVNLGLKATLSLHFSDKPL
jgi:Glycosyl transferase family 2